jgi:hypothetical protein
MGKDFLSRTQEAQQLTERIDKWNYTKLKSFCTTKEMVSKLKRPVTEWEKNLCQLYTREGTDNQIYKKAQKTETPKKSMVQ